MLAKTPNTNRPFGVDVFTPSLQRNELNSERIEFAQRVYELTQAPRKSIVAIHDYGIELIVSENSRDVGSRFSCACSPAWILDKQSWPSL